MSDASSDSKLLFISWSGLEARNIATGLRDTFSELLPDTEMFVSPLIPSGTPWPEEVKQKLDDATHGLGIITDHSARSPWLLFEAGYLVSRLSRFPLLNFWTEIPQSSPLSLYQNKDGENFTNLVETLLELFPSAWQKGGQVALTSRKEKWEEILKKCSVGWTLEVRRRIRTASDKILAATTPRNPPKTLLENRPFQEIVCKAVEDLAKTLQDFNESSRDDRLVISLQRMYYPEYLEHLQKLPSLNCSVRAIAYVDDIEEFWDRKLGYTLATSAKKESERVFVFKTGKSFLQHWKSLVHQAEHYNVYALSSTKFHRIVSHPYDQDYSIIRHGSDSSAVLAKYGEGRFSIDFITSEKEIKKHEREFTRVREQACKITLDTVARPNFDVDALAKDLFSEGPDSYLQMSERIDPEEYDLYEEDHPYFREMMQAMIEEMHAHCGNHAVDAEGLRILELGAGTGHFTKRIAQQPLNDLVIEAIEFDDECYKILERKFRNKQYLVKTVRADSIDYDPDGHFDVIFSSFAEHHIQPEDKQRYFRNVRNNLAANSRFIVGDEFLRPHDRENADEHNQALHAYHGYVIGLAESEGHHGLAKLERDALACGLEGKVDFKLPLGDYLRALRQAGLECEKQICISPEDLTDTTGGIYVLVVKQQKSTASTE